MNYEIYGAPGAPKSITIRGNKLRNICFGISAAILLAGLVEFGWVLFRIFSWPSAKAKIVSVKVTSDDMTSREYRGKVDSDGSANQVYSYFAECMLTDGTQHYRELNISNRGAPSLSPGDMVDVACGIEDQSIAIVPRDMRTWAVPVFITSIGALYSVVTGTILKNSKKKYEVADIE